MCEMAVLRYFLTLKKQLIYDQMGYWNCFSFVRKEHFQRLLKRSRSKTNYSRHAAIRRQKITFKGELGSIFGKRLQRKKKVEKRDELEMHIVEYQ